tara:strand:- start:1070 stop:2002 length:933 start_codon:yes stop_codon:yes gene_type:complete
MFQRKLFNSNVRCFGTAFTQPMLSLNSYKSKTVLVTGGGTGLGRAIAEKYLQLGANVVIASRNKTVLNKAKKDLLLQINNPVQTIHPYVLDVRSYPEISKMIYELEDLNLFPDVIINNAAGNFISPTEKLSSNAINSVIDIVLNGTINITHNFGKHMILHNKNGVFLNISATYGQTGCSFVVPSAVAKAGCDNLVKSLSSEWGKYGIRLIGVAPGPIYTKGAFTQLDPSGKFSKNLIKKIPMSRLGTPEELANLVSYLTSDYANWITGSIINFDGGETSRNSGFLNDLLELSNEDWQNILDTTTTKKKVV